MGNETTIPLTVLTAEREKAKLDLATATARIAELEAKVKEGAIAKNSQENIDWDKIDPMADNFGQSLASVINASNKNMMNSFREEMSTGFQQREDSAKLKSLKGGYEIFSDKDKDVTQVANIMLEQALKDKGEKTEAEIVKEVAQKVSRFKIGGDDKSPQKTIPTTVDPNVGGDASHLEEQKPKAKSWEDAEKQVAESLKKMENNPIN